MMRQRTFIQISIVLHFTANYLQVLCLIITIPMIVSLSVSSLSNLSISSPLPQTVHVIIVVPKIINLILGGAILCNSQHGPTKKGLIKKYPGTIMIKDRSRTSHELISYLVSYQVDCKTRRMLLVPKKGLFIP